MRRTCAGEAGVKPGHILVRLGAVRDAGRDGAREHMCWCVGLGTLYCAVQCISFNKIWLFFAYKGGVTQGLQVMDLSLCTCKHVLTCT